MLHPQSRCPPHLSLPFSRPPVLPSCQPASPATGGSLGCELSLIKGEESAQGGVSGEQTVLTWCCYPCHLHGGKLRDGTWLWLGRQEEALIAADPTANSVCLAAGLNLAWRCPERSPACRGEVTGAGAGGRAVKTELDGRGCDCYCSARAGGELGHRGDTGRAKQLARLCACWVARRMLIMVSALKCFIAAEH